MGELKKRIKAGYKNINNSLSSLITDIKNIKNIGFNLVWERNKSKIIMVFISIIVVSLFLITRFSLSKEEVLNKFQSALINVNSSML